MPGRFLIDGRHVSLGEFRLMDLLVQSVSLVPHLLQRDLATLTAEVDLDAANECGDLGAAAQASPRVLN